MTTKPRVAIIGCGGMARAHALAVQTFGGFELVAAADPMPAPLAEMKKVAPSIRYYEDSQRMLEKEKPDVAVVATPMPFHARLSLAALRAGAHVLCEKPFTLTLAEADELIDVARQCKRMLLVDHQFRINPRAQAAMRVFQKGALGPIVSMRTTAKGRYGGWEMIESGTHLFDLALLFAGPPLWVSGQMFTDGHLSAEADIVESTTIGRLSSGLVVGKRAHVVVGFANDVMLHAIFAEAKSTNFLEISGTSGVLHVPLGVAAADAWFYPEPFVNPNHAGAAWQRLEPDWGQWGPQHNVFTYELWLKWLTDPTSATMAIEGRHPMDAHFARQCLEIIHGAFESHFQGGRRVALPLDRRDHPLQRRQQAKKDSL